MQLVTNSQTFHLNDRTHIMGILNTTPDSFSDGGTYNTIDKAVERAVAMEQDGADIIDIGGESTHPRNPDISLEEELNRVIPIIKAVKQQVSIPVSIDTYKAETARQSLDAGAEIVNDIFGGKQEPEIARAAAEYDAPMILMQKRDEENSAELIESIKADFQESISIATSAGVAPEKIVLDPGLGFAKAIHDDLNVMRHLDELTSLGYPLMLGASRKSFLGDILALTPDESDNASGAPACLGITKGAQILRVHDVKRHVEWAKIMDAMLGKESMIHFG